MISHRHRCIFVHVPKTAGQSIEAAFLAQHGLSWEERAPLLLRPNDDLASGPERLAHLTAREYVACGHLPADTFADYFKFAFVRNPWDRLVSEYRYRFEGKTSFASFVRKSIPVRETFSDFARHIIPQSDYLLDENGDDLVDFTGRFETLADDFAHIAARLELGDPELPHRNLSANVARTKRRWPFDGRTKAPDATKRHYSEYYDDELREFVADYYASDIALFGYRFTTPVQVGETAEPT